MTQSIAGSNLRAGTTSYTPVKIPRPAEGVAVHKVRCLLCYEIVTWKVLSVARTARARRRWLLIGLAGLVSIIAGVVAGQGVTHPGLPVWVQLVLVVGGFVALVTAPVMWFYEQGVRVPEKYHGPRRPRRDAS